MHSFAWLLFTAGIFVFSAQNSLIKPIQIPPQFEFTPVKVKGTVNGDARVKSGNTYFTLSCRKISTDISEYNSHGLLPCVIYNRVLFLTDGSVVTLKGRLKRFVALWNPISYGISRKDRFYKKDEYRPFTNGGCNSWKRGGLSPSQGGYFQANKQIWFHGQNGLLHALTIGDQRFLLQETKDAFIQTGTAHLLAVSGMNVGVLALVLNFYFHFFR